MRQTVPKSMITAPWTGRHSMTLNPGVSLFAKVTNLNRRRNMPPAICQRGCDRVHRELPA